MLCKCALIACVAACAVVPVTPEQALNELIESAVAGRTCMGSYQNIDPTDPESIRCFNYVEEWLNVNGESVMGVRSTWPSSEGNYRFVRSGDGKDTYIICLGWPGSQVRSKVLCPEAGSKVTLLGWPDELPWEQLGAVFVIDTPREMADEENHPCKQAFVFKVQSPK